MEHGPGCNDFHRTRRALVRRPLAAAVPVPAEVLETGAAPFLAERRSRREFLAGGLGAVLGLTAATRLRPWELLELAAGEAADAAGAPIFVTLYLDGGNDGLNTLVPISGRDADVYRAKRTRIAIDPASALSIPGHGELGWHPQATGFKTLLDAGKLVAYLGVDYPNPSYSHFDSAYYWRTGQFKTGANTGWLGNYLDRYGSRSNPLQGVAVEYGSDDILHTAKAPTCALFSPGDFSFGSPGVYDESRVFKAYADLAGRAGNVGRRRAMDVVRESAAMRTKLHPLAGQDERALPPTPVAYPDSDTGRALRNLARMLGANLGIRVATVRASGSFDTHSDQPTSHGRDLADAADALVAFQADLAARGLENQVVTMIWSEFGRRIEDNASSGTDHGAGSCVMIVGKRVHPGVSGTWQLAGAGRFQGNVPVAVDFRDIYAGVLAGHLQADPRDCLPGYRGRPLKLFA